MIKLLFWQLAGGVIFALMVSACKPAPVATPMTPTIPAPSATLRPPQVLTTSIPDARSAAQAFLDAWSADNYEAMYARLTPASQASLSLDDFKQHFRDIMVEGAFSSVDSQITSYARNGDAAQVDYHVVLHSSLVGDVAGDTSMNLVYHQGNWGITWDDTLVLADLNGGNYLKMDRNGYIPARGLIYDRNGQALMEATDASSVGLSPDNIDFENTESLFTRLYRVTGIPIDNLTRMVDNALPGDYFPLGEYTALEMKRRGGGSLYDTPGVTVVDYTAARFYLNDGVAPHAVGYVSQIPVEQLDQYRREGYVKDEMVGQRGLEKWGEPYLLGTRGGALYVNNAEDQPIKKLAERVAEPSQAITTTLDMDFQTAVQQAIEGYKGAIVVLERDTGRVLAMASSPSFDPNAFTPGNYNGYQLLADLSNPDQPLFNRATEGQYPLGSVFKIVTISAALESGVFTPESTYDCQYAFNEIPGITLYDWTWDHFQKDGKTKPSGMLTLPQGLIRSCNPWFYHIGLTLYEQGLTHAVSDMARAFGLGSKTGITGVEEVPGNVPDPGDGLDATSLAIGQGSLQVTPLQVADFVAAVGNGGTLYTPQIIEQIGVPGQKPTFKFEPKIRGMLPLSPENLKVIQDAMVGVIKSTKPRGTAYSILSGMRTPMAGKTGTATSSTDTPHAWFAGYTFAGREDKPDIAIAVVVENIGEGSEYAAPIFRRVVYEYFTGSPGPLYPWEEKLNVWRTPTPEVTETPPPDTTETP